MANVISDETIDYVGILAKLELSEEEKEQAKKDMGRMLDYIDKLAELDTTEIEPMSHVFSVQNVFSARVSDKLGMWETTLVVHIIGLIFALIMVFAFGMSIPDSKIVVHTKTLDFASIKSCIISSILLPDICPCAKETFASGTKSAICFAFLSIPSTLLNK